MISVKTQIGFSSLIAKRNFGHEKCLDIEFHVKIQLKHGMSYSAKKIWSRDLLFKYEHKCQNQTPHAFVLTLLPLSSIHFSPPNRVFTMPIILKYV